MSAVSDNGHDEIRRAKLGPVPADEIVDDRALESADDDRFRLNDFVDELAQRCRVTSTPANIALYGPWGSGKSSLGNLLRATFSKDPKIAFGRFDAFKFAEVPLRRHFLASVADWFDIKKKDYSDDLYKQTREQRFTITARGFLELLGAIVVAAVCLTLVMSLAALVIAGLSKPSSPFGKTFVATLRASAPGILIAAPIVGGILAMAFDRFKIDTTISAPFSDEEFERRFEALVKDIKEKTHKERVVIFIDELDRCSPKQVGSVLETLRTFLDVDSCVFVVAADQQVLEHALMEGGARQATPSDSANPYYSSGSAYLDKIFHQQIPLPPLLPRTLSQFALRLVESRGGVWTRVPNHAELVSVLIPTHVRSPRRVKTLLNTFSSLYRLAILRAEDDVLDTDVERRASEIGKLVCLRTEFPLFARDLSLDARLPQVVLVLVEKPETTLEDLSMPGLAPEIFERARAYAAGRLPVADLLSYTQESSSTKPPVSTEAATEPDESDDSAEDDSAEGEAASTGVTNNVQRIYALQLVRYLQRTAAIPGPRRDLIYLESSGRAFGLPPEFADRLEDDARDGRTAEVAEQVKNLESSLQVAACRLLAQLIVEGSVGLETRNVVKALLAAATPTTEIDSVSDELLAAIANYGGAYELDAEDLEGALRLALASESASARTMRTTVLSRAEVVSDRNLGLAVLGRADLLGSWSDRLGAVLVARLDDTSAEDALDAVSTVRDDVLTRVIAAIPNPEDKDAGEEGDEQATPALETKLSTFARAAFEKDRPLIATAAFDRLLALDTVDARTEAANLLPRLAPISDQSRCRAIVGAAQRRVLSAWPTWLNCLEPGSLEASEPVNAAALTSALARIWSERFAPAGSQQTPPTAEDAVAAAKALAEVGGELPLTGFDAATTLTATQPSPVTDEAQVDLRTEQHAALWAFQEIGLITKEAVADAVLTDMQQSLNAAIAPAQAPRFVTWVAESGRRAIDSASPEAITAFADAVQASSWFDPEISGSLQLLSASARRAKDISTPPPLTPEQISELLTGDVPLAEEATSRWIETFNPDANDAITALRAQANARTLTPRLRKALGHLGDSWDSKQKTSLFETIAPSFVQGIDGDGLLRDLRMGGADPDRVAQVIVELFENAANNAERDRVLRLWAIAQPSSQRGRQSLVDKVFVPLVTGGKGQAALALDHFGLVSSSVGKPTQTKIKHAFDVVAAEDKSLQKRVNRVLQDAGWIKRPRRFKLR